MPRSMPVPRSMPDCTCGQSGLASTCAYAGKPQGCAACGWNRYEHRRRLNKLRKEGLETSPAWPYYRRLVLKAEAT